MFNKIPTRLVLFKIWGQEKCAHYAFLIIFWLQFELAYYNTLATSRQFWNSLFYPYVGNLTDTANPT